MSTITQLLCHNFGGIRQNNACFTDELITAQDIQNVELYYTGANNGVGIRTMKGNQLVLNIPDENIINIFETIQNGKYHTVIHTETKTEGKLYLYFEDTLTLVKDGLQLTGASNGFDVAQGWKDLFFFTTGKEMLLWEIYKSEAPLLDKDGNEVKDEKTGKVKTVQVPYTDEMGNTITMLEKKDRDKNDIQGLGACLFDNRLWVFNKNKIWYSKKGDFYDWGGEEDSNNDSDIKTTAGYIEELKNITAIHEYLGSLAVFFADSSILLSINDGVISQSEQYVGGCAGINALVFHDTNLYFYDNTKHSIFSFQQVITGSRVLGENIAIEVQDIIKEIGTSKLDKIKALSVYVEDRNEIWFDIPVGDEEHSTILIYDYLKKEWVKRKSQKLNAIRVIDNKLYSADTNGNLLEEYKTFTFNGEYIQWYYKLSPMNLGADNTLKVLVFQPRVSFDLPYWNSFYVKYIKNYNTMKKPKVKFIKTKYRNVGIYGVSLYNHCYYRPKNTAAVAKFPNATFRILEIEIFSRTQNDTFSIRNLEMSKIKVKQV